MKSSPPTEPGRNWAGNYSYQAKDLYRPETVSEIQTLVSKLDKVKALGSRHCFNDIADSPVAQISTENLNQIAIDEDAMTVTIGSGLRYGQICPALHEKGYALHNLASLPHISVAGACATATHGSGVKNGNLATAVSKLEFVSGTGDLITLERDKDQSFYGAVVNLGALGIVTKITLDIEKTYLVRQDVFQNLALYQLKDHFNEIMASGYSVSLFTDWQNENISQVWVKRRVAEGVGDLPIELFGATAATDHLHPLAGVTTENRTEQLGIPGVWYDRLPHFKMGFTPSHGEELQTEYFVPARNAVEAILAVEKKRDMIAPLIRVSEIRAIAADEHWISPCYKQDCVAIHFTWRPDVAAVMALLPTIEAELEPFSALPHWGKLFTTSPTVLRSLLPRMSDFIELQKTYDPQGKFRNSFLARVLLS
ncbi:FAD-binding protein [soil metagenome]